MAEDKKEVKAGTRSRGEIQGVTNVVFMGMGEPLANYKNMMESIRVLNDPKGIGIGARHITCLLYTSPSPRDRQKSRMPSSA